jgi:hypothetical protein
LIGSLLPSSRQLTRVIQHVCVCEGGSVDEQGGGRAHPQLPQPAAAADLPASRRHNACAQLISPLKSLYSLLLLDSFPLAPTAVFFLWRQADVETDEVYAQMTLQPLNPVSRRRPGFFISQLAGCLDEGRHGTYGVLTVPIAYLICCAARAERRLPARGDGHHEQAADELLLQDADGQRHQHARRLLRAPPFRGARPPASGVVECV